jgi:hypothetical protein
MDLAFLNNPLFLIAACILSVVLVLSVFRFLDRGGKIKLPGGVELQDNPGVPGADPAALAVAGLAPPCTPVVTEHTDMLDKLQAAADTQSQVTAKIEDRLEVVIKNLEALHLINEPQLEAQNLLLRALKGEKMNGNVDEALAAIDEAKQVRRDIDSYNRTRP